MGWFTTTPRCGPDGFVVFDLVSDHGVKDYCDFVGSRRGGGPGTELSFHSAQIVAQGSGAMMEGKGCQAKDMASAIFDRSYSLPQQFSTADVVVWTKCYPGSKVCCSAPLRHVSAYLTEQW